MRLIVAGPGRPNSMGGVREGGIETAGRRGGRPAVAAAAAPVALWVRSFWSFDLASLWWTCSRPADVTATSTFGSLEFADKDEGEAGPWAAPRVDLGRVRAPEFPPGSSLRPGPFGSFGTRFTCYLTDTTYKGVPVPHWAAALLLAWAPAAWRVARARAARRPPHAQ